MEGRIKALLAHGTHLEAVELGLREVVEVRRAVSLTGSQFQGLIQQGVGIAGG